MKPMLVRAVLLAGACAPFPAMAQDADPAAPAAAAAPADDNIIVITGTRVLRSELDFAGYRRGQFAGAYGGIRAGAQPLPDHGADE